MEYFSKYDKLIINKLVVYDEKRDDRNNYLGIPVLIFLSEVIAKDWGIYASYSKDKIEFEYSVTEYTIENKQEQKKLLDNQRKIIYILHLIQKLSVNSYIACIDLNEESKENVISSLPDYSISKEIQTAKIAFDIYSLQKSFSDILFQAIIVTDDLKELVAKEFKTVSQIRHEDELGSMEKQLNEAKSTLCWTRWAFVVALIPAVFSIITTISSYKTPKDITIRELKTSIDNKKIPHKLNVQIINDTLVVKPIEKINIKH